jgi:radical SAM superfamily enzyme YgiQ (UPF0313 family)
MKIFLGDLVHTWEQTGTWTIPLNIGYVASYTSKYLNKAGIDCNFKLFKDPQKMIDSIKSEKPDVVGLAHYVWNMKLNHRVFEIVKKHVPNSLTIGGGPYFTDQNANENGARRFFSMYHNCDAYIVNQGEKGFFELIKVFSESNKNLDQFRKINIPGSLINDLKKNDKVHIGKNIGALSDLNDIPSPYLNGLLDTFFEGPYMPLLETNRSCPYRCTFCAWGIGTQKLLRFDEERVLKEIEYIYERSKFATSLYIADANFGILDRDSKFAAKIYEGHKKTSFPNFVAVQWNKTRPDRVLKTAKEFRNIAQVGASLQSINGDVLNAIKRKNLTFDQIVQLRKELEKFGQEKIFSELIIGLPYETKESHIEANRQLIDLNFEVQNYNLHLLPGTEMDTEESRKKYFKKTGWRLFDNAYGIYDGKIILEGQEVVLLTDTLSIEDFRYIRFYHFLQQMMWSKKWYYDYLKFLKSYGIHPVSVFKKIIEKCKKDKGEIGNLYSGFMKDYDEAESFDSFKKLEKYWRRESNFNRLKEGNYGKLNMLYTFKLVLNHRKAFNKFLLKISKEYSTSLGLDVDNFVELCKEVLKFQNAKFLQIDNEWKIKQQFTEKFKYDLLKWRESGYGQLEKLNNKKYYKFYISKKQQKAIDIQLRQYKSNNINSTFQKMVVNSDNTQFFYEVRSIAI